MFSLKKLIILLQIQKIINNAINWFNRNICISNKKDLVCEKEGIGCIYNKTIQKMVNFDDVITKETKKHNPTWPQIPNYLYRILIIWGSGSWKTNLLFNLISQQLNIAIKIHMKQNIKF